MMTMQGTEVDRWRRVGGRVPKGRRPRPDETLLDLQPHPGRRMTEREFLDWVGEKTRAEWVDGEVIVMSPVSTEHDDLQSWLISILRPFVESNDLGRVGGSELAVRLERPRARRLTDIFFVSRERVAAFEKNVFAGSPDVVFEIVSPDSTTRDYRDKLQAYESSGVKEYWIIDPLSHRAEANELAKGRYKAIPGKERAIHSKVIKGFWLRPSWFWQQPLPKVLEILKQLGVR
jgi:Uma2 family endonuclease